MAALRVESVWSESLLSVPIFELGDVEKWMREHGVPDRKQHKGYEKHIEGFVHEIKVKDVHDNDSCSVKALSYRSLRKNERPYKIQLELKKGRGLQVIMAECECKAGTSLCSHIVGLVYTLAHFKKLGLKSAPPVISKTSQAQSWHIPSRHEGLENRPVQKLTVQRLKNKVSSREGVTPTTYCPVKQPIPWYPFASNLSSALETHSPDAQWLWMLKSNVDVPLTNSRFGLVPKGSVLSYQQKPIGDNDTQVDYPDMTSSSAVNGNSQFYSCALNRNEYHLYISCIYDLSTLRDIELKTRKQHSSSLWRSVRSRRITASNFHRVIVRQGNEEKLAEELLRGRKVQTKAMKYGLEHEGTAAELYEDITGNKTLNVGFVINVNAPHIGASPDRIVMEQDQFGLLEIKCPQNERFADCKYLVKSSGLTHKLKTNHAYYQQVQGQMAVTGLQWCDFFVKAKEDYHLERIFFNSERWSEMKCKIDKFYFETFLTKMAETS